MMAAVTDGRERFAGRQETGIRDQGPGIRGSVTHCILFPDPDPDA